MTLSDLIDKAGGPKAIAEASQAHAHKMTFRGVQQWRRRGIPATHYDLVAKLSGVDVATIHRIDRKFRDDFLAVSAA